MKMSADEMWPPGFRFHPTDEELILYYLKKKICKKRIKLDIIAETDVYKWDPEELPGQSLLKTRDRQWFFFSPRDRKYPNGARSNRATRFGYWKATGKDRNITCNSRNVGVKKTLVFYRGRAPTGERTDWVMHEYTLDEDELKRCQNVQEYYALYKVFKKSGPGPKNGEQYGAPFKEEDWVDDDGPDVTNSVPPDIPPQQLNEIAHSDQALSLIEADLEEFIKQLKNGSAQPQVNYANEQPQVVGEEEAQSTLVNLSSREVIFPEPVREFNERSSFDFTQSASSNVQLYEASEVSSAPRNGEQVLQLCEEDFLEMDDLIGPEPTISPVEKPAEKVQFDEFDGLNELDLFQDVAMFFHDMGSNEQDTVISALGNNMLNQVDCHLQAHSMVNQVDYQLQPNSVVTHVDYQLQPNSVVNQVDHQYQPNLVVNPVDYDLQLQSLGADCTGSQMWMHNQISNGFDPAQSDQQILCPPTSGLVQEYTNPPTANQNQNGQEGGGGAPGWLSSSLWAFVESIPTTPASASENPLVNRAFERMSSFSRIRINAKTINVAGGDDVVIRRQAAAGSSSSSRRFLFLSIFGALCAILWMLMGSMRALGRCIFS